MRVARSSSPSRAPARLDGAPRAPVSGSGAQGGGNPLAGVRLFVDHDSPSWHQWRAYRRSGPAPARRRSSGRSRASRRPCGSAASRARTSGRRCAALIVAAKRQGAVPLFTVMRAVSDRLRAHATPAAGRPRTPARAPGTADLARTLGHARVVIAFEPDSLGTIDCHARSRRDDRLRLLRYGVDALARQPERDHLPRGRRLRLGAGAAHRAPAARDRDRQGARVHAERDPLRLDARQHQARPRDLAPDRRQALRHQHRRERARADPLPARRTAAASPSGATRPRGLGPAPTTNTSNPMVDAYLWINRPGYAQGCQGRPIAWYAPRALATRATRRAGSPRPGHPIRLPQALPVSVFAGSR